MSEAKGVQSIPGGGVGGAPPPGTGFASGTYPTLSHSATHISTFVPPDLNLVTLQTVKWRVCRANVGRRSWAPWRRSLQGAFHPRGLHGGLPGLRPASTLCGAAWETRGAAAFPPRKDPR